MQNKEKVNSEASGTRINKYLSEVGYCSRRAADALIEAGRVTVNKKIPEIGTRLKPGDVIRVDNKIISEPKKRHVYLAFNKPRGIVCTTDVKSEKNNIIDYINHPERIFPIGRLDKPSEGLILLTSDGDIVNKILRAKNNHEKEYFVTVDRAITDSFLNNMKKGVPILGTVTLPCKIEKVNNFSFKIILTQGLNRQIRRMCEYLGYSVTKLKRIRIMHIHLDLPTGKWRNLTQKELDIINKATVDSSKVYEDFE